MDLLADWEGAVAFRLFAEQQDPTLTVSEQIAARVGDRILSGQMPTGTRIGEQELADEFNVSRGPIRDALRILEREGLVSRINNPQDRRAWIVCLTTKGRDTFQAMAEEHEQWILELFAGLPASTVQQLYSQLGNLRVQLVRQQEPPTKDNNK